MAKVFIGVDPHKLSATIEVVDHREKVLATGRFATDKVGYAAMRKHVRGWPERVWAVEGSNGAGRPLAQRLLADGEHVVDVPAKLSARARLFDTGHNRKTDAHDAHAVAVVAVRTAGLRVCEAIGFSYLGLLAEGQSNFEEARALGISGVPFFVIDRKFGLSGAQPPETFTAALNQAWQETNPLVLVKTADGEACGPDGCAV